MAPQRPPERILATPRVHGSRLGPQPPPAARAAAGGHCWRSMSAPPVVLVQQRLQTTQRGGVALIGVAAGGYRARQTLLVNAARVAFAWCLDVSLRQAAGRSGRDPIPRYLSPRGP